MKSPKNANYIFLGVWLLQLLAEGAILIAFGVLDMLPLKYYLLLSLGCVILLALTGMLLFWKTGAAKMMILRRSIAGTLAALVVLGCAVGTYALIHLHDTIHNVTNNKPSGVMISILVRHDDPARTLQDAADYRFGYVEDTATKFSRNTIAYVSDKVGKAVETQEYKNVFFMVKALYEGEVDAVILNSAYAGILLETPAYEDFEDRVRVLAAVYEEELPQYTPPVDVTEPETQPTEPEKNITNTPFVVYISGSDTREDWLGTSLSDVNILMAVNPVTKQVLLVNTPRDYFVPNPAANGALDKLTHCGIYGINTSMQALEWLYDIDVAYYAHINFVGFKKMIDAIGGVTVYADQDFKAGQYQFHKGENFLDGDAALAFARNRKNVNGGDNGRGKNQMRIITAIIQKMMTSPALITNFPGVMEGLSGMFATSASAEDISSLMKMQLEDMASWDVMSWAVTGIEGHDITYSMPGQKLSIKYIDKEKVEQGTSLINRVLAGEKLTKEDLQ